MLLFKYLQEITLDDSIEKKIVRYSNCKCCYGFGKKKVLDPIEVEMSGLSK